MPWTRPASLPVGQVWRRFQGREKNGEPGKMYQIRDVDPSLHGTCLDMMQETFLRDEPLCHIFDINSDPESIATVRKNWEGYLEQGISLACYTEVDGQPDELVGFNILLVKGMGDVDEDFDSIKGESWKKILKTLTVAEELVDVFKKYNICRYLTSSGVTVVPDHRGQNIGKEIFAAREPLCVALGIRATATVFTAKTSQVLAAKCGFKVLAELNYEEMAKYGIHIENCDTQSAIVMGKYIVPPRNRENRNKDRKEN